MEVKQRKSAPCVQTWDFTWNTEEVKNETIKKAIENDCIHWAFQREKGSTTGNVHYQGRIQLRKKKRCHQLLEMFPDMHGAHWSPTAEVNKHKFNYVLKVDTRIEGPWTDKDVTPMCTREARIIEQMGLLPWQESVVKTCDAQLTTEGYDGRSNNVLIDLHGNSGKGSLKSWLKWKNKAQPMPTITDVKQVVGFAVDYPHHAYVFDWPRAIQKKDLPAFYAAVETIKDGWLFDVRYKGREVVMERPCIWVFTNQMPDLSLLSMDRWRLWTINENKELVEFKAPPEEAPKKRKAEDDGEQMAKRLKTANNALRELFKTMASLTGAAEGALSGASL